MSIPYPIPVTADEVGADFVSQYYTLLQHEPESVQEFYNLTSNMLRIDGTRVAKAITQYGINEMVLSLNFTNIENLTWQCWDVWGGRVVVVVSGFVQVRDSNGRRKFLEMFFLVPEDDHFFVHLDVFSFTDQEADALIAQTNLHPTAISEPGVTVETILEEISNHYSPDPKFQSSSKPPPGDVFDSIKKLRSCEQWLLDLYGVREFKSLNHGEFFDFLEKHVPRLPTELQKLFSADISAKPPLEVSLLPNQFMFLVSQASTNLWEDETITKQMISALLLKQYPLPSFRIVENGSMEEFLEVIGEFKSSAPSKRVLFSATLSAKTAAVETNSGDVTSASAMKVLLKAPMLSDLKSWSDWDHLFAPSLGPLVEWLLSEANTKELLCLVTRDAKVVRINPFPSEDSFLEAARRMLAFETALELLSLLSLAGGEKYVRSLLLKSYARQAFDAISIEFQVKKVSISDQCLAAASRYVLNFLGYLPSEFHGFAADILLDGMRFIIKDDAAYAILRESTREERIMLHEIGLSIGVVEWIDDYQKCPDVDFTEFPMPSIHAYFQATRPSFNTGSSYMQNNVGMYAQRDENVESSESNWKAVMFTDGIDSGNAAESSENKEKNAALVVESIRKYEFGLDPNYSCLEVIEKMNARSGRALHYISKELYSEDSHFLLELVQNADDNIYPESVEPTLAFILQESGIVVLNNEQGFTEQDIRALCDVGSSTKKGSATGHIGKKGIGFKSVFRVTDAPEIHSNGFHIKFDISGGQIGFVLPTVVDPCNIESYTSLIRRETGQMNTNTWNTCILLPFRSNLSGETAMKMFNDLRASLLFFLHRLKCIMFLNMLDRSHLVMRKKILEDDIVKVSCGKHDTNWLVQSQKLEPHTRNPEVQKTEIAMAFPLKEDYSAHLELQPVFAFLPLRTYGLTFIIQGDFVLPSSRQDVDKNDPWNEWLMTKFPGLFVRAKSSFLTQSCYRENPGKALSTYMSFVPLVGEVQGFFSGLPKAIALELQKTNCLLLEGDKRGMVIPSKALRGWSEQARELLPNDLLQKHLELGFLDRNIVLSDSLARALGIVEYGPEILIKFLASICHTKSDLKSMGLQWLSSFLDALYMMLLQSSRQTSLIGSLKEISFIPLSDGTYSEVDRGDQIWLHSDSLNAGFDGTQELKVFPQLYAKLRIVNPAILVASAADGTLGNNTARMLQKIGVQKLSGHEIVKGHILRAMSSDDIVTRDKDLITDYLCFVMVHLQSNCSQCCSERQKIISELLNKACILTNFGHRRLVDTSIHFSEEFGNPINAKKLIGSMKWYEVDVAYLKHPVNDSLSDGEKKWRSFLREIGVKDFVQVVQTVKKVSDLHIAVSYAEVISGRVAEDWESREMEQILSRLCSSGDREGSLYLLEVLDTLWDDELSSKAYGFRRVKSSDEGGTFKSSFLSRICDAKWVASSMDNDLHYPRDLFHDCDAVRSLLGGCAPYALPKVGSAKFVSDIGFKTKVTLSDALEMLRAMENSNSPSETSIAQMSRLYSFIQGEIAASKKQVLGDLHSAPFIFVPYESVSNPGDTASGVFLSAKEVYWQDPTGCVDLMKDKHPRHSYSRVPRHPSVKTLCNVYLGLYDFFVKECGVREIPSCLDYFNILQQISTFASPSQAAGNVFRVFMQWADGITSGSTSYDELNTVKKCLLKAKYAVLPTVLDKWVSLHPSFGTICWCDDKDLKQFCKDLHHFHCLKFGSLTDNEENTLQKKVSVLLQNLGIPALSKIITREAIYDGPTDPSSKASLINGALPYAQRYIYSVHPDEYLHLKHSGFSIIKQLNFTVVKKLSYRIVLKSSKSASKKQYECSCLLQGNTLYATLECDLHALFLELSCLFLSGASKLNLANYLFMISTMMESGYSEDQIEQFISNSQKIPKLPDEEPPWPFSFISSPVEKVKSHQKVAEPAESHKQMATKSKKKAEIRSGWPPDPVTSVATEIGADWTIVEAENFDNNSGPSSNQAVNPTELPVECDDAETFPATSETEPSSSTFKQREKFLTGRPNKSEYRRTGKSGERIAFEHLTEKFIGRTVKWVNDGKESGLQYDIVIDEGKDSEEYYEVKATKSESSVDWFHISFKEWEFAAEKKDIYTIIHVLISVTNNPPSFATFPNPVKQFEDGDLKLIIQMPENLKRTAVP